MTSTRRRSLRDVTADVGPVPDVIPARPQPPAADGPPRSPRRPVAARQDRPGESASGTPRPSARDLITPARQTFAREALKADVPADLALIQRLRRYRLDNGVDIRDQVAIAVDEWLTREGY